MSNKISNLPLLSKGDIHDNDLIIVDDVDAKQSKAIKFKDLKEAVQQSLPVAHVVETKDLGNSYVILWSNGWFEQYGYINGAIANTSVTLWPDVIKVYYANVRSSRGSTGDDNDYGAACYASGKTLQILVYFNNGRYGPQGNCIYWEAKGKYRKQN